VLESSKSSSRARPPSNRVCSARTSASRFIVGRRAAWEQPGFVTRFTYVKTRLSAFSWAPLSAWRGSSPCTWLRSHLPGGSKSERESVGFRPGSQLIGVISWTNDVRGATDQVDRLRSPPQSSFVPDYRLCGGSLPLFSGGSRRAALVRGAGIASGCLVPFGATPLPRPRDQRRGLLGVVAFVVTMSAIGRRGTRWLSALATCVLSLR